MQPPHNRWGFQNVAELLATVRVSNETQQITELAHLTLGRDALSNVSFEGADGLAITWNHHLEATFCDAVCVIHNGVIVEEKFFNGMNEQSQHLLMSITKSFTAAALGVAIGRGLLSINDLVTSIAPEFAGTSLDGCKVRHLIDMTAGTDFVEDYDLYLDPDSDVPLIEYERQAGFRPLDGRRAIGVLQHFRTYQLLRPHGQIFDYRSPLTNIVARILEIVNGMAFSNVISRDIWTAFGMEHSANISVDPVGFSIAEAGLSCTVRDLARFGLAYLNDGKLNDQTLLPKDWVTDTRNADDQARDCYLKFLARQTTAKDDGLNWYAYHNAFWIKKRAEQFTGWGIFGQYIWIDRPTNTVIARFSTYPEAAPEKLTAETLRGFNAIAQTLHQTSNG